ncbi:hypothetical protein [Vulgatibacter sp.]|uniref:hypothetical protein n=1 Tax=Vulgatibacter sp. TaxID=1971226 RepID=UPI003565B3BA
MGESRLERGLRAVAWTALVATLLALIGVGIFFAPPSAEADETKGKTAPTAMTPGAAEENE